MMKGRPANPMEELSTKDNLPRLTLAVGEQT